MKKKLISMLLAVLMIASLFSGMSVSAYADDVDEDKVITYTMKQGDTVLKVCTVNGVNYYTCKNAIMLLNGFTSDADFRFIPVGKNIKVPKTNEIAVQIASAGNTGTTGTGTTTVGTGTAGGDSVAYYLVPHTMQRGETIYTVCSALGISYNTYAKQIQGLNNLNSLGSVKAGQTILFPQTKAPAVGTTCYKVMNHKVNSGETAYTICNTNGVSYNGNLKLLQALNNKDNLNYITAGASFYVPVQTVIQAAPTNTATPTPSAKPGTDNKDDNVKKYDLTATSTTGGTAAFYVDGKAVTSAAAGSIVTVVATPEKGFALESIEVVYTDGSAAPKLNGDTFVMPTTAVTANVRFTKGYDVNIDCGYTNAVKVMVNGVVGSTAPQNSDVSIVSNNPSLSIDGNIDIYRADNGQHWKTIQPGRSFSMPSFAVTAKVKMKTVDTYGFFKNVIKDDGSGIAAPETGSFVLQVNGSTVSKAAEGTTVKILASPSVGYTISKVEVNERLKDGTTGSKITVKGGESFTMPACNVNVTVSFAPESAKINIKPSSHGALVAKDGNNTVTLAMTGSEVKLEATPDTGYSAVKPIVTSTVDGTYVTVNDDGNGKFSFIMPGGGADVVPQFVGADRKITWSNYLNGGPTKLDVCRALVNDNAPAALYGEGQLLAISAEPRPGYKFVKFEIWSGGKYNAEMTASVADNGSFTVGTEDFEVRAFFQSEMITIENLVDNPNYKLFFVDPNNFNKTVEKVAVSSNAVVILSDWTGGKATLGKPIVKEKGTGTPIEVTEITFTGNPNTYEGLFGTYTFVMPAAGVDISVPVTAKSFKLSFDTSFVEAASALADLKDIKDNVVWASTNDNSYGQALSTGFVRGVDAGLRVKISLTDAAIARGYKLTSIKYAVNGNTDPNAYTYLETGNGTCEFTMPAGDVVIKEIGCARTAVRTADMKKNLANCGIEFVNSSNVLQNLDAYTVGSTVCFRIVPHGGYSVVAGSVSVTNLDNGQPITLTGPDNGGYYRFTLEAGKTNLRINATASNTRYEHKIEVDSAYYGCVTVHNTTQGKSWTLDQKVTEGYGYDGDNIKFVFTGAAKDKVKTANVDGTSYEVKNNEFSFKMPNKPVKVSFGTPPVPTVLSLEPNEVLTANGQTQPTEAPAESAEPTEQPTEEQPTAEVMTEPTPADEPGAME